MAMQYWRRAGHIPVMITLQIIFIILFAIFVIYNPANAVYDRGNNADAREIMKDYPLFQDVHVMIFIGFGFLMTFLKKYGLSAVSLNMMCAVLSLQWGTLVIGFFHLHYSYDHETLKTLPNGTQVIEIETEVFNTGKIYLDLVDSMLYSDFAAATVLISFGVVIGTTSPLQLIFMTLIEIVIFEVNEVIGRKYFGAIDAGDSIFVHTFGAYFGLAASRMLYSKNAINNKKQGSGYTSDLFSMIGTIFLWMFWPSFNSATAVHGEAQHRAILNTYFSMCSAVMAAFAFSGLLNEHNKFVMEHIQNATLAGGVAVGAVADLFVQPYGALLIGSIAGAVSVIGFEFITPWLEKTLKIHDTCGVHNLHGIPGVIGTILSAIMVALADKKQYGTGYYDLFPALQDHEDDHHHFVKGIGQQRQAINQILAGLVTLGMAFVGGSVTGLGMRAIGRWQAMDEMKRPGSTVIQLAINVGNIMTNKLGIREALPENAYFDDNLFFEVHGDEKVMIVKDKKGNKEKFDAAAHGRKMSIATEEFKLQRSRRTSIGSEESYDTGSNRSYNP